MNTNFSRATAANNAYESVRQNWIFLEIGILYICDVVRHRAQSLVTGFYSESVWLVMDG